MYSGLASIFERNASVVAWTKRKEKTHRIGKKQTFGEKETISFIEFGIFNKEKKEKKILKRTQANSCSVSAATWME